MTGSTSVQSFGSSTEQRFVLSIAQVPFYHTRSSPDSIGLASGEIPGGGWCATCLYSYLLVVSEASLLPVDRDRKVEHAVMPGVVEDRHGNVYKHLLAIGAKPSEAEPQVVVAPLVHGSWSAVNLGPRPLCRAILSLPQHQSRCFPKRSRSLGSKYASSRLGSS